MIRAVGTNTNQLPKNEFNRLFIEECKLLGSNFKVVDLGFIMLAVIKND